MRRVVRLEGEQDLDSVPRLYELFLPHLEDTAAGDLDLDLRDVEFCDSSFIRVLQWLTEELARRGRALVLRGANRQTRRLLSMLRLTPKAPSRSGPLRLPPLIHLARSSLPDH